MTTPSEVKHLFNEDQITSANAYFDADIDGESVRIQATARFGSNPETIADQISSLIEGYRIARAKYPRSTQPAPVNSTQPASEEKKKFEVKPVSADELPESLPADMEAFKEEFDEIEVTPQADNKVSVAFYRNGLKYPIGARINKWANANAVQALSALGEVDVTKAAKLRLAGVQYYTLGAEYIVSQGSKKGEKSHYKDLRLIEARF